MKNHLFQVCIVILAAVVSLFAQNDLPKAVNYNAQGIAQFKAGKPEAAVELFNRAIAEQTDYAPAYYNLGSAYLHLKQFEKAKAALLKAIEYLPEHGAYNQLGMVYLETGQDKKAV